MTSPFHSQTAIVTCGAFGIGRALCQGLARHGALGVVADIGYDRAPTLFSQRVTDMGFIGLRHYDAARE